MQYFHQQCYHKDDEQISTVLSTYYMSEVFSVVSNFFLPYFADVGPKAFHRLPLCMCVCVCLWCEQVGNGLLSKDVR